MMPSRRWMCTRCSRDPHLHRRRGNLLAAEVADVADVVVSFIAFTKCSAGGTGAILSTNTADAGEATDVLDSTNTTVTVHPADSATRFLSATGVGLLSDCICTESLLQCFLLTVPYSVNPVLHDTSSGILDIPFQSNAKCDVIIRKYLSPNDVLSSGAHDEGHDGVSSTHAEDHGGCSTRREHHHCWYQAITHARKADDRAPSLKLGFFVLAAHFQVCPMFKSES